MHRMCKVNEHITVSSLLSQAAMLKDRSTEIRHGLPANLLGPVPLQSGLESKVSPSHQALLQHLLQKEQMRQQKILSSGKPSFLVFKRYITVCSRDIQWNIIKYSYLSFVKAPAPCRPTLSPLWPWRIAPPAVVLNYQNTGPWTEPSPLHCPKTHWPNLSSSSNTSTSWRSRNSTSSRST